MNTEKQFVDGLIAKKPKEQAPDFIKAGLSFKIDEFAVWVGQWKKANPGKEWLNIELKESKSGKYYAEVDTWEPNKDMNGSAPPAGDSYMPPVEDIPF
jgi:hypothetical protein